MLKPRVEVRECGGVLIAEFWDCLRLDPAPVQELRRHFEAHLKAGQRPDLVADLNGISFAGSAALGGFLTLNRLAKQQGGRLAFCNLDANVFEVFRVSRLDPLFLFAADLPAALAMVQAAGSTAEAKTLPESPRLDELPLAPRPSSTPLRRPRRNPS